jgi:hypothetical protein
VATAFADPFFTASNVTFTLRSPVPIEKLPDWRAVIDVRQDFPDRPKRDAAAIDLRRAGWLQLATFVALAAAWPPRGRRRIVLAASVAFAIVSTCIAVPVVDYLAQVGAVHLGTLLGGVLALVRRALIAAPGMAYAVPGLAWLALMSHVGVSDREGLGAASPRGPKDARIHASLPLDGPS